MRSKSRKRKRSRNVEKLAEKDQLVSLLSTANLPQGQGGPCLLSPLSFENCFHPYMGQGSPFLYLQLGSPSFIENLQCSPKLQNSFSSIIVIIIFNEIHVETYKCWVTLRLRACLRVESYKVKCSLNFSLFFFFFIPRNFKVPYGQWACIIFSLF